jgi:hypothetical protein
MLDRFVWDFTTPAFIASAIRKFSIFVVRRSLSSWQSSFNLLNASANVSVAVCSFQICALYLCSATHVSLIQ